MTLQGLEFVANGQPKGEPRARSSHGRHGFRVHRDSMADPWKTAVRRSVLNRLGLVLPPQKPVFDPSARLAVVAVFRMPRPLIHHVARDRRRRLRDDAPRWVGAKPDVDNLLKAVLDALGPWPAGSRSILWADDQQVVAVKASKEYATPERPPGVGVAVRVLEEHSTGEPFQEKERA